MSILDAIAERTMKNLESNPKPGAFCDKYCKLSADNCPACLARQEKITARLSELETLEKNIERMKSSPEAVKAQKFTKCTLCAAPYVEGASVCPYCDTPYPADALTVDLPVSGAEQDKLLLDTATSVYAEYTEYTGYWRTINNKGRKKAYAVFNKLSQLAMGYDMDTLQVMNSQQIRAGAKKYEVGYREYIYGIMVGTYKSIGELELEEKQIKMQKEQEEMQKFREQQQAQFQAQQAQRQNRQSYTMLDYMQQRAESGASVPKYLGGGGGGSSWHCCGQCAYYGGGKCACSSSRNNGFSVNASDSCGFFRLK
ncbi:MAG: hypothetical protein NC254_10900 [bacterium]|nr:hypothetical protein [bacterium]